MKNTPKPDKRRKYDAAFRAEALGLAEQSRFIAAERDHYPVRRLCQVLDVPASGYYAWQAGQQRGPPRRPGKQH